MKNIKALMCMLAMVAGGTLMSSCKKDRNAPLTDLVYEVAVEGNEAKFTTKTTGITAYKWEFGDGETSTDANPTHNYPGKGKYVPTLYATIDGKQVEASTVLRIAKTTPVKINDNSLADWDAVTKDVVTVDPSKGVFRAMKFDYDGNYVYMYAEMARKKSDADIFDFYIDSDNNPATGLLTGTFPGGGYDILLEGQLLTAGVDIFYHNSTDQNAFSFAQQSISEAYTVGTVKDEGGIVKFEVRFARGKLKGMTGSGLRVSVQAIKNDWSVALGAAPHEGTPSYFLDMSE